MTGSHRGGVLRFVLGDQLNRRLASLRDIDPEQDTVLLVEVEAEATYVRHHKQKIAFILSAIRHFAEELRAEGIAVDYVPLDAPQNTGSFTGEVARAVARHAPERRLDEGEDEAHDHADERGDQHDGHVRFTPKVCGVTRARTAARCGWCPPPCCARGSLGR